LNLGSGPPRESRASRNLIFQAEDTLSVAPGSKRLHPPEALEIGGAPSPPGEGLGWRLTGPLRGLRKLRPPRGSRAPEGARVKPAATAQKRHGPRGCGGEAARPRGQPWGSKPRRTPGDALKRPPPAEQGPEGMRAARLPPGAHWGPLSQMPPKYRRRVKAGALPGGRGGPLPPYLWVIL